MRLSGAKNSMHRAVKELFFRSLNKDEKDLIWKYFESRCVYCDKQIERKDRHGHMDHLDCSAFGGGNYVRNRVLACKECNGNEKREGGWEDFLKSKCINTNEFRTRRNRIMSWQKQFRPLPDFVLDEEELRAKASLLDSIAACEESFKNFRRLLQRKTKAIHAEYKNPWLVKKDRQG